MPWGRRRLPSNDRIGFRTLPIRACQLPSDVRAFIVSPLRVGTPPGQGPWPGGPTSGSYSFRRILRRTESTMGGSLR